MTIFILISLLSMVAGAIVMAFIIRSGIRQIIAKLIKDEYPELSIIIEDIFNGS